MAKKTLTCEVMATVKGLDPQKPKNYVHAGTQDNPTLVELVDDSATRGLIASGAVRIYPGPRAAEAPQGFAPLKPADLKSLRKAEEVLEGLIGRYQKELEGVVDEVLAAAIKDDIAEAEADLARVRELTK